MSVYEKVKESIVGGIGAVLAAPATLPVLRPVTKGIVKTGLYVSNKAKGLWWSGAEKLEPDGAEPGATVSPAESDGPAAESAPVAEESGPGEAEMTTGARAAVAAAERAHAEQPELEPVAAETEAEPPRNVEALESAAADVAVAGAAAAPDAEPPWQHLRQIPDFTEDIAEQCWALGWHTFDDVRRAAEDGRLAAEVRGIAQARQAKVLKWLREQVMEPA
jgi:hypothetical protein